jgi:hypothetical protein
MSRIGADNFYVILRCARNDNYLIREHPCLPSIALAAEGDPLKNKRLSILSAVKFLIPP